MADWQTDLMQQVSDHTLFDAGLFNVGDAFGLSEANARPPRRHVPAPARAATPDIFVDTLPSILVRHVGRLAHEGLDQPAVRDLVALLLRPQWEAAFEAHVDALLTRGLPPEHIFLRLFQPAARLLGEMWADDACTFVDVTLATAALQSGLRRLAPRFHRHGASVSRARSVLLCTLDGDQHTFGLAMAAEFFRRSGWTVQVLTSVSGDALARQLQGERNAVVGFSASRADQLPALSATIRRVRRAARDRLAGIVVGGPLFATSPECSRETGADAIGLDARHAVAEAEALASAGECG